MSCGFSLEASFRLRTFPSISSVVSAFIMKGCWTLSNAFPVSLETIVWLFPFLQSVVLYSSHVVYYNTFTDFEMLNQLCIPNLVMECNLFYVLPNSIFSCFAFQSVLFDQRA